MSAVVISGWSAVSPFGIGRDSFAAGLAARPSAAAPSTQEWGALPGDGTHLLVPGFTARDVLGKKGTRSMDRVSALAVATVRDLLDAEPDRRERATGDAAALVLGTTTGSAKSMMDITRDTLIHEKPFYIDAARIPNAIMNSAAAQCAIWHHLTGPNTTVGGGRVAALSALRYAGRLLNANRARTVLCGGAEEFSAARAWLEHHSRVAAEPTAVLGEGCGLLLVESGDGSAGPVLAEVLAVESGVYRGDPGAALRGCLDRAFARSGVEPGDLWAVSSVPGPGPLGDAERDAVDSLLTGLDVRRVPDGLPWGDAGAVSAAFQIAALLSAAETDPDAPGRAAVVVAVDRDGVLGAAVLRMGSPS